MKLIGVVITYYPNIVEVRQNILSYINNIDKLIIWQNTPKIHLYKHQIDLSEFSDKVMLMGTGENMGIAYALNKACSLAINNGYSWILTMDQDSSFSDNTYFKTFNLSDKYKIGIFSLIDGLSKFNTTQILPVEVDLVVASGNVVNLHVWKEIGMFNEKLFIDGVDHDYCFRNTLKGYKVMQCMNILLNHQLGETKLIRTIKGSYINMSFHSPLRTYYIFRNNFYIFNKYKKYFPASVKLMEKALCQEFKHIVLYSDLKLIKIKFIVFAYIDYKRNKLGKYSKFS